jgi:hypothetical protein
MWLQVPPGAPPVIVKLAPFEQKSDLEGLAGVLLGSLGLAGAIVVGAIVFGTLLAGLIFLKHSRDVSDRDESN